MGPSLKPQLLVRAAEVTRVLVRHGGGGIARSSGLSDFFGEGPPATDDRTDPSDLAIDLERLGPTFVKLGQLLASRRDLLGREQIDALSRLQDDVEPIPYSDVRAVIESELEVRLSNVFASFDEVPIASASLAQVHRASLRDGRRVAVKVQRPGIREVIATDMETLSAIAEFLDAHAESVAGLHLPDVLDEFERSLVRELDYRREEVSIRQLRSNLRGFPRLTVPWTVPDLCTSKVLTMQHIEGIKLTAIPGVRRIELDGDALVDELLRAYLQQLLADGFVHADPHPGNVLLTDEDRLALIDVGMVVRIEERTRERLLRLLLAVADGDGEEASRVAVQIGTPTRHFDEEEFRRNVRHLVSSHHDLPPGQTAVGGLLTEMMRVCGRTGVRPPPELTLLARTLMSLDQVAEALSPGFDVDEVVRRHASEVMTSSVLRELTPGSLLRAALEAKELVESFPGRLNAILSSLAQGSLQIQIDAVDADRFVSAVRRGANRVTAGVVLAALILGAALMARVETQATVLGYPALALAFFVSASVIGLWLVITTLRSDE